MNTVYVVLTYGSGTDPQVEGVFSSPKEAVDIFHNIKKDWLRWAKRNKSDYTIENDTDGVCFTLTTFDESLTVEIIEQKVK